MTKTTMSATNIQNDQTHIYQKQIIKSNYQDAKPKGCYEKKLIGQSPHLELLRPTFVRYKSEMLLHLDSNKCLFPLWWENWTSWIAQYLGNVMTCLYKMHCDWTSNVSVTRSISEFRDYELKWSGSFKLLWESLCLMESVCTRNITVRW